MTGLDSAEPAPIHPNPRRAELQVRNGCVVAVEETTPSGEFFVAIWPESAKLTDVGVELGGNVARFDEPTRLTVSLSTGNAAVEAAAKKCGSNAVQFYTAIVPE